VGRPLRVAEDPLLSSAPLERFLFTIRNLCSTKDIESDAPAEEVEMVLPEAPGTVAIPGCCKGAEFGLDFSPSPESTESVRSETLPGREPVRLPRVADDPYINLWLLLSPQKRKYKDIKDS
jgi:hypothetical protein